MRLGLAELLRSDREEDVPLVRGLRSVDVERAEMLEGWRCEAGLLAQLAPGRFRGRLAAVDHAAGQLERDPAHALLPLSHEHDLPGRGDGDGERIVGEVTDEGAVHDPAVRQAQRGAAP